MVEKEKAIMKILFMVFMLAVVYLYTSDACILGKAALDTAGKVLRGKPKGKGKGRGNAQGQAQCEGQAEGGLQLGGTLELTGGVVADVTQGNKKKDKGDGEGKDGEDGEGGGGGGGGLGGLTGSLGGLGGLTGGLGGLGGLTSALGGLAMVEDLLVGLHINKTINDVLKQAEMAAPKDITNQVRDVWNMPTDMASQALQFKGNPLVLNKEVDDAGDGEEEEEEVKEEVEVKENVEVDTTVKEKNEGETCSGTGPRPPPPPPPCQKVTPPPKPKCGCGKHAHHTSKTVKVEGGSGSTEKRVVKKEWKFESDGSGDEKVKKTVVSRKVQRED